jgi:hypothetical protein
MEIFHQHPTQKNFHEDLNRRIEISSNPEIDNYCNCYSTAFYLAGMVESPYLSSFNSGLAKLQFTFEDIVQELEQNNRILAENYNIFKYKLQSKEKDFLEILHRGILVAFITKNNLAEESEHWMFIDQQESEYIYQRRGIGYRFERIKFEMYLDENKIQVDNVHIYGFCNL